MIKYIGSKRTLVPRIEQIVRGLPVASACDLFAGTTRVAQTLRKLGLHVVANDLAQFVPWVDGRCVVQPEHVQGIDDRLVDVTEDLDLDEEETFELVGPGQENPDKGRILTSSPIGQGMIGRKKGDVVEIQVPRGKIRFKILDISMASGI